MMDQGENRGSALVVVVGYTLALSLFAGVFWSQVHQRLAAEQRLDRRQAALNAAEAGIDRALAVLRTGDGSYAGGEETIGAAAYRSEVTALGGGLYRVASEGWAPLDSLVAQRIRVTAVVRPRGPGGIVQWETGGS